MDIDHEETPEEMKIRLRKAKQKIWRDNNKELQKKRIMASRAKNPESARAANRRWRDKNRDAEVARSKAWREESADKYQAYYHSDQTLERNRKWKQEHPEKVKAWNNTEKAKATRKRYRQEVGDPKARKLLTKAKERLGAQCSNVNCKNTDLRVLQFAHVNQSNIKNRQISKIAFRSGGVDSEEFWQEVEKCQLFCANCRHIKKYYEGEEPPHQGPHWAAAIAQLGGKCKKCKTTDTRVLQFDHVDPSTKITEATTLRHKADPSAFLEEIQKCQLLCANCHHIKTNYSTDIEQE